MFRRHISSLARSCEYCFVRQFRFCFEALNYWCSIKFYFSHLIRFCLSTMFRFPITWLLVFVSIVCLQQFGYCRRSCYRRFAFLVKQEMNLESHDKYNIENCCAEFLNPFQSWRIFNESYIWTTFKILTWSKACMFSSFQDTCKGNKANGFERKITSLWISFRQ